MASWQLDREGFITHYMVSGPKVSPFTSSERDTNQLRYETRLRSLVAAHAPVAGADRVSARENSRLGLPWRFSGGRDGAFINLSDFYAVMRRVEFDAAAALIVPRDMTVRAVLWSYAAVDVYVNGIPAGGIARPVYKPISRSEIALPLRAGKNVVYLACETLGVRDTRSVAGLQLPECRGIVQVGLADGEMEDGIASALRFAEAVRLEKGALLFPSPAPEGTRWAAKNESPDHAFANLPLRWHDAAGETRVPLPEENTLFVLEVPDGETEGTVSRTFEVTERILPRRILPVPSREENTRLILRRIADVESLSRGKDFGFPIANMLARKALGDDSRNDKANMDEVLDLIEKRVDCADFLVCGLIRYLKNYPVDGETAARVRDVLTGFRYWMDQDGFDGMCFWSENHCLMFYASAMQAGEMFPEAYFTRARMTGRELSAWGGGRVAEWLDDVEKNGFEEFLSTVYACVTFAVLLNVIDYSPPGISSRARAVTDRLLRMLALHTFKGGVIAPQGRVYRGVLYPFRAGAMALMNMADPSRPYDYGEGWLGFAATSGYTFPEDLKALMDRPASLTYVTGNARVVLEKHEDWCLTSVEIPREPFARWENETKKPDADPSGHAFVKSYNECFHGTTCFQPGVFGYQQHLWHAALDAEAAVFINHPGSDSEGGDMRPGYWHGNGVFPALKQEGNVLGLIFRIPDSCPLRYIHLYCPECRFDEVRREGGWLLLRKGPGFIGVWSGTPMEKWNGENFGCELRMWGDETACLCVCAGREIRDMAEFAEKTAALRPVYDKEIRTLSAAGFTLTWTPGSDDTQYL